MGATAHGRLTVEEFEALPEPEGERWELIDGEVVVSPARAWGHGAVVARLVAALVPWAREHGAEVADAPGQPAARDSELVPDLALVLAEHTDRIGSVRLDGPADLVVEVSSPSHRHRDLGRKREVYEQIGVAGRIPAEGLRHRSRRAGCVAPTRVATASVQNGVSSTTGCRTGRSHARPMPSFSRNRAGSKQAVRPTRSSGPL